MTGLLYGVALPVAAASAVSAVALLGVQRLLHRWQVVDTPNARSSHDRPVLRGGGLGPAVSVVICWGGVAVAMSGESPALVAGGALAVVLFAALGWYEDVRGVHPAVRAGGQLMLAGLGVGLAALSTQPALWLAVAAVVGLAAFVNVTNFMDGVNGISGLFGAVAGTAYAVLGLVEDVPWLTASGLVTAGAFATFLPWNALRPRMFLGDVGSYALGASLGLLAVGAVFSGLPVPAVVAPLAVYLADTGFTLVRRVRAGERWYEAHRSHTYQRLTAVGLSHLTVAVGVAAVSGACAVLGLLAGAGGAPAAVRAVAGLVLLVAGYLTSPRWLIAFMRDSDRVPAPRAELETAR